MQNIEEHLHKNIPLSKNIGVKVKLCLENKVILSAPVSLNINHKKTVFGGSLNSLATLSCFCLVYYNLKIRNIDSEIVISHSQIKYILPVNEDFEAVCEISNLAEFNNFLNTFEKRGKARIALKSSIYQNGNLAVDFQGKFVALTT